MIVSNLVAVALEMRIADLLFFFFFSLSDLIIGACVSLFSPLILMK